MRYYTEQNHAKTAAGLSIEMNQPDFPKLIRRFLYDQLHPDGPLTSSEVSLATCPFFDGRIFVYYSASATFFAPSDLSGVGGMRREHIRATPSWRKGPPRYDCVFLNSDPDLAGMLGLDVVRVLLFFSFKFRNVSYPCAFVSWYSRLGDEPDENTGMWKVEPEVDVNGSPVVSVIHLDCVLRAAHLIGVYGEDFISADLKEFQSLDTFRTFYVNKFADHHAFEIAS
jgi:hypothetical protein